MTNEERKALEDLIEAVETAINAGDWKVDGACDPTLVLIRAKEALAQPEQWGASAVTHPEYIDEQKEKTQELRSMLAQPEQEPVAVVDANDEGYWADILPDRNVKVGQFLYTTPPQRKPLTVDEVWQNDQLMSLNAQLGCGMDLLMEVVEAIEAAHGIKE